MQNMIYRRKRKSLFTYIHIYTMSCKYRGKTQKQIVKFAYNVLSSRDIHQCSYIYSNYRELCTYLVYLCHRCSVKQHRVCCHRSPVETLHKKEMAWRKDKTVRYVQIFFFSLLLYLTEKFWSWIMSSVWTRKVTCLWF